MLQLKVKDSNIEEIASRNRLLNLDNKRGCC